MKIIAFIEEPDVIQKILVHLALWDVRNHDPPIKIHEQVHKLTYDYSYVQPAFDDVWAQ